MMKMIGKIARSNIFYKPLNTVLCVSLMMFGVGIITLLLLIQNQLEDKFQRDLRNIDLVVGAKGSPLQLVLSAIYHLDAPTGNIRLAEARKLMDSPIVEEAIPLAYGDSYQGFRIVGTTNEYLKKYEAKLESGRNFSAPMEATLGAAVAAQTGLSVGDTFLGTHGEADGGHVHDQHPYTVVSILEKTNTVLDRLVLCTVESVWQVHDHQGEDHSEHEHDDAHDNHDHDDHEGHHHDSDHDDAEHNHDHGDAEHNHDHGDAEQKAMELAADSMEITALLLKYKSKMSVLNMPRIINEQTNMQAVLPGLEINRLFYMLGIGATTLKFIAGAIMVMAGFSVFFVLYSRLRDRRYELALMRSVGYEPKHLFGLLLLEGLLLVILGYFLGWLLSRVGLYFINQQAEHDFNLQFGGGLLPSEMWLFLITILVGLVSALLPAWQAMRMNVSATLSEN